MASYLKYYEVHSRSQGIPNICTFPLCSPHLDNSTQPATCDTGDVRLVGGTVGERTLAGRVEVCVNNAWGTVCGNRFFDNTDAGVICQQIGGFTREGNFF